MNLLETITQFVFDEWNDSHRPLTDITTSTRFIASSGASTCVDVPSACLFDLVIVHKGNGQTKDAQRVRTLGSAWTYPTHNYICSSKKQL